MKTSSIGYQQSRVLTITYFGFFGDNEIPLYPPWAGGAGDGVIFVHAPLLILYFQTDPVVASPGPW
jgi:hypothetical protein